MKKKYKVAITYQIGDKQLNNFINSMDLGICGVVTTDGFTFNTTTKPSKKMKKKYIDALHKAAEESGKEILDIQITYLI